MTFCKTIDYNLQKRFSMKYIFFILLAVFSGCSVAPQIKETKIVTLKTPKLKFNDIGYVTKTSDSVSIDLYIAGKALKSISIDRMVCISGEGCISKDSFNNDYLYDNYPSDLLKNVLLAKPIYNAKGLQKSAGEFSQTIKNAEVDIRYIVNQHATYFKDRKNNILIKLKDTK